MRDDLLDAQACVEWTITQLPGFAERLGAWLGANIEIGVEESPPESAYNPIVAVPKAPLPRAFNVEAGAYINTLRSSIDVVATALAYRYGIPKPNDHYFPVAKSEVIFKSGRGFKGAELVQGLPDLPRQMIEALKPYQGGNKALWFLHQLDIERKHRRLLEVEVRPLRLSMVGREAAHGDFIAVPTGALRLNEKTVLGQIRKGAPDHKMEFIPHIAVNEPGLERKPVIAVLNNFVNAAELVIAGFDLP
jgi:hypothetical protein